MDRKMEEWKSSFGRIAPWVKKQVKWGALFGSEMVLSILAVLGCFVLFLIGLKQIFPSGDPTRFWFQEGGDVVPAAYPRDRGEIRMNLPGEEMDARQHGGLAARLTFTQNDVKAKKSDEIVWARAKEGLGLFDRDAVQTLSRSSAVITFDEKNYLDMDENSLVIIKRLERNRILKERRSFMVVIDGSLRGRIDADGPENVQLEIATPTAVTEVNTRDSQGRPSDFQIHVNPDQTSTVTVYSGVAKVMAQGVTVEVRENQVTQIGLNSPPEEPQSIQEPVSLKAPEQGALSFYRDFPPEIIFAWSPQEKAVRYHLQIAREASFRDRVLDEITSQTRFLYGNLKAGNYFWRVASLDAEGIKGEWSEVREIEVVQKRVPPPLQLAYPKKDEVINQEKIWINGNSDATAVVYVNGRKAKRDSGGRFKEEVRLRKGINLILVESVDPAGNVSFERRMISRKF
jgi:hypothetical protein